RGLVRFTRGTDRANAGMTVGPAKRTRIRATWPGIRPRVTDDVLHDLRTRVPVVDGSTLFRRNFFTSSHFDNLRRPERPAGTSWHDRCTHRRRAFIERLTLNWESSQ